MGKQEPVDSRLESLRRRADARIELARGMGRTETRQSLKRLTKPSSISGTLRKAGAVLLLSPDPLTDIPAIAIIGVSYVMKKREPLSVGSMMVETRKTLHELASLF